MKLSNIFQRAGALAALFAAFATARADEPTAFPELTPGEATLVKATLPGTTGGEWTGGDASPLGGVNELDYSKTDVLNAWLFQPTNDAAKSDAGYPLLLFLHGAGERGDNPALVGVHGPFKILANADRAKEWKFFTVAPQCPGVRFWSPDQMILLIKQICDRYPIDRSRIYVTGLSMGGFGTWGIVAHSENLVAAAAPLCGGYGLEFADKMTKTPIWAFHGDADGAVNYEKDKALVEAVKAAGNEDIVLTTYPGVGHDCWTRTYDNPELYDWFLSKSLESTAKPGEMTLREFVLPAQKGAERDGSDALDETRTETRAAWVFVPTSDEAKSEAGYPLLFFLHGAGERGSNPEKVKVHGPPKILSRDASAREAWPFITVSPQCPDGKFWSPAQMRALLDKIFAEYPIDRSRVYVTGVSMGGFGTWAMLARYPELFAAGIPICGWYPVDAAPKMTMPIWAFHGEDDPAVPCDASRNLLKALEDSGNEDARLTTYPGVGHDSWTRTYDNPEIYKWLLSKEKK
ncbi:MAG: prolyl oligopeptidase family serine peptidase [Thermoguttaceae bacterium]|nr:prolyl oligopeptidase family serine peptidase [Thermoguttaceae bacterium]